MTSSQLKKQFITYFQNQSHQLISSASLIPENDPSVLFTTAGMHPLVPYLMGEKHPEGQRLVSVQKCLRTGDIDEVGDATHHTFFEMLGNWSLGDYFKKEAIAFSWQFLTEVLKLDKSKLAISIFGGNQDVPDYDQESEQYWLDLGVNPDRIEKISANWWGPAGQSGPCGPDTEMFYWTSKEPVPQVFHEADKGWVEIWNDVIMQYDKTKDGHFVPLKQKNIDTGMGLERTLAVLNGFDDNYLTQLWQPIIKKIEELSGKKYDEDTSTSSVDTKKSFRIIADHIRSAVFVMGDSRGIAPSNKDQGYILRRLIRRAIRFAKQLSITNSFCQTLSQVVVDLYKNDYPELSDNQVFIFDEINKEEEKFSKSLEKGLKVFDKNPPKSGKDAFMLYSTYGFPIEMIEEEAKNRNLNFGQKEKQEFLEYTVQHANLSTTASAGMFKGGLADDSIMATRYHTATHLLHQALRDVLGNHVEQRGSNINEQRLRFDFVHDQPLTKEQIEQVEEIINDKIRAAMAVSFSEMSVEEAKQQGAIGLFDKKYGEKVKVYQVGDYSKEICGGPHVQNTQELGHFKIKKEQSSSAGIRRIKAVLE